LGIEDVHLRDKSRFPVGSGYHVKTFNAIRPINTGHGTPRSHSKGEKDVALITTWTAHRGQLPCSSIEDINYFMQSRWMNIAGNAKLTPGLVCESSN
jgi:hypothetical protein